MKLKNDNERLCLHCGKLLPKDCHKGAKFHPREVNPDGSINSCHDDYHNEKKRPEYHKTKKLKKIQFQIFQLLDDLYITGNRVFSKNEIEKIIDLRNCIKRVKNNTTGYISLIFIDYLLEPIDQNTFEIKRHNYDV